VSVRIVDTLVQGDRAPGEIARALAYADNLNADVIVTGRGGGSAEDLWAFNEEIVADTLYRLKTPVVSAVGHEVDILISDFISDLRAPTPSAAIEMILPDKQELLCTLDEYQQRFGERIAQIVFHKEQRVKEREEVLRRFSIAARLIQILGEFSRLKEEYRSVISYKLEQHAALLPPLIGRLQQQTLFVLEQKRHQGSAMQEQYSSSNPRNRAKEGWAKVTVGNKSVSLDIIRPEMTFVIEDADTKIEAICRQKYKF
ncbi:MAG: exodeoxyribonuclease VII large subunit, partial [Campylobacterota bacterium]|nr:exodeoxyribonuclease VII large subunit [Campylobacterota bacterium]